MFQTTHNPRMNNPQRLRRSALLALALVLLTMPLASQAQDATADRLAISDFSEIQFSSLPKVELQPGITMDEFVYGLTYSPEGRLLGLRIDYTDGIPEGDIVEVFDDGSIQSLNTLVFEEKEDVFDLSFGPDGLVYLLTQVFQNTSPPRNDVRLTAFDPVTWEIPAIYGINVSVRTLAPSRRGMWLLSSDGLRHLDLTLNQGQVTERTDLPFTGLPIDADTDSSGAIWYSSEPGIVDPPIFSLRRLDPDTGSLREVVPFLDIQPVSVAIERGCPFGTTSRCLLGGRFQVTSTWKDFEGRTGTGKLAPSGSTDSALFWFFEPSNWEVLVKVIDGCAENGHYWVFAAGTTDVEHTLRVTDLVTGQTFESTNALGMASEAVTATNAFPCD